MLFLQVFEEKGFTRRKPISVTPCEVDPCEVSAAQVRDNLQEHWVNDTLHKLLTEIDMDSESHVCMECAWNGGKETRLCETQLHHACRDPEGRRGEEKLRIALNVAAKADAPFSHLLSVLGTKRDYNENGARVNPEDSHGQEENTWQTPIFLFLDNNNSTVRPLQLIANAWPDVVNLRVLEDNVSSGESGCAVFTVLSHFSHDESMFDIESNLSIIATLLEFADKTSKGAKGLISFDLNFRTGISLGRGGKCVRP